MRHPCRQNHLQYGIGAGIMWVMKQTLNRHLAAGLLAALASLPTLAPAQSHDHTAQQHQSGAMPADPRRSVTFPEPLRTHTLANMRDHLSALGEIQGALSRADYDAAAEIAEKRLGMSSLAAHGAHDVARHMPKAMQDAGTAMHRSASQFAVVAKDASVSGDLKGVIGALVWVNQICVVCHTGFRLQ